MFSLITQVVGRSGRAKEPGFAIIQTTDPDNPVLTLAAAQDYDAFYEQEIDYRRLGLYPPSAGCASSALPVQRRTRWRAPLPVSRCF